jgi:hypothetical protein
VEFAAKGGLEDRHFSFVSFVVLAGEMEEAVEEKDFYFIAEGVAVGGGLAGGGVERDGEVAGVLGGECGWCGEAEDVSGFVFAAEVLVEVAEGWVVGEQDVDCSFDADGGSGAVEEAHEAGAGEAVVG